MSDDVGGVDVEVVDVNSGINLDELRSMYLTIIGYESVQIHDPLIKESPEIYDPQILERIENLRGITKAQYEAALTSRDHERELVKKAFGTFDAIILPTVGIETPDIGQREVKDDSRVANVWGGLGELTNPWNVLGFPAIFIPIPVTEGLPLGFQIVGKPDDDEKIIELASKISSILEFAQN